MMAEAPHRRVAEPMMLPEATGGVRLYLCRHGQTDYNAKGMIQGCGIDRELSEVGLAQAVCIGEALREVPLDVVGSSTLKRAMQTAEAVRKHHATANSVEHRGLREMDFGDFEGKRPDEVQDLYDSVTGAWAEGRLDAAWPAGESPLEVVQRARQALIDILGATHQNTTRHVALVTHGRLNKILLSSLLGLGLQNSHHLTQANCCINVIDIHTPIDTSDSVHTQVILNYVAHLQEEITPSQ